MDTGKPYFHNDLTQIYLLFYAFPVKSPFSFIAASIFIAIFCWIERFLTYTLNDLIIFSDKSTKIWLRHRAWFLTAKTIGYTVVTALRFWYMLIVMNFHFGTFCVVITSLATGQFMIEYLRSMPYSNHLPLHGEGSTINLSSTLSPHHHSILSNENGAYKDEIELKTNEFVISDDVHNDNEEGSGEEVNPGHAVHVTITDESVESGRGKGW